MKTLAYAFVISLAATAAAQAADTVHFTGKFAGLNNHTVTGTAKIVTHANGAFHVVLSDDFSLDGAPDPKVSLGTSRGHGTVLGDLKKLTGEQHYVIPSNVRLTSDTVVWIWCEKFSVPLGSAG